MLKKEISTNLNNEIIKNNADKTLIGPYTYEDLKSNDLFYFDDCLSKKELESLKYINNNSKIKMSTDLNYHDVIDALNNLNKKTTIELRIKNKNEFNNYVFNKKLNYKNIMVYIDYTSLSLDEYKKKEKKLLKMIEPAMNLSPFEKYVFAYNIVKQFKPYQKTSEEMDKRESRSIYKILNNKYIVCVGYTNLFGDLLEKLGIESTYLHFSVDTSYDSIKDTNSEIKPSSEVVNLSGHARRYVHVIDKKYNIDGFYISDPTWDSNMKKDLYNHMVMTNEDINYERRYILLDPLMEMFDVNNIEEFYNKLNYAIYRTDDSDIKIKKNKLLISLLKKIEKLDIKYHDELLKKYPSLNKISNDSSIKEEKQNEIFEKIGEYIVRHVNNDIPIETIMTCIINVYKNAYGFDNEDIDRIIPKVIEDNKEYHAFNFPKRYKIDSSENKEIIMNEKNKFDFKYEKISKKKR